MNWREGATRARLDPERGRLDGERWHFQHGPIDLIIDVDVDGGAAGEPKAGDTAVIEDCWRAFQGVLPALVAELPALRQAAHGHPGVSGGIARRMLAACAPFAAERFITPMAAVAGAVADEVLGICARPGVRRASINNGGDIALWLTAGSAYRVGIWSQVERLAPRAPAERPPGLPGSLDALFAIDAASPVRGIATSGWRGRSQSLGIADSVTVLARSAAAADAAATLIANAVNCDAPGIVRAPAVSVKDDSDLGERLVTVAVPPLPATAIAEALAQGRAEAVRWQQRGLIEGAVLFLQGHVEIVAPVPAAVPAAVAAVEVAAAVAATAMESATAMEAA
jgi:ApbE superfamily uncharacterized protein (UPF0280 family)